MAYSGVLLSRIGTVRANAPFGNRSRVGRQNAQTPQASQTNPRHCQTNQNLVRNLKFEPTEVVWIDNYIRSFIEQRGPKCGITRVLESG